MLRHAVSAPHSAIFPKEDVRWGLLARVAFRFIFCYLLLHCLDLAAFLALVCFWAMSVPSGGDFNPWWHRIVPWAGTHVLHLSSAIIVPDAARSSSDTTYDFVVIFCELVVAAVGTLLWSVLDRKRANYRVQNEWLRFAVRLILGSLLINYGAVKVFPFQFGTLSLASLSERVGDLSPMGLLWTFMARSQPYSVFTGAAELMAGILILIPSCTLAGALLSTAIMSNVLALNLCYGVPVKLMSLHMLLLSVFLVAPDTRRLANIFLFNRTVDSAQPVPLSTRSWVNRTAVILPIVIGALVLLIFLRFSFQGHAMGQSELSATVPMQGIWAADEFTVTGDPARPLLTDKLAGEMGVGTGEDRWQELIFGSPNVLGIRWGNGVLKNVDLSFDKDGKTASVSDSADPVWKCMLSLHRTGESLLRIEGTVNGSAVTARFHRLRIVKMPLTSEGFRWITE